MAKVGGVGKSSTRELVSSGEGDSKFIALIMGVCVGGWVGESRDSGVLKPEFSGWDFRRGVMVMGGSGSLNG